MNMTCIVCPMGCSLTVEQTADGIKVSGNTCPRGVQYAIAECTAPTRTLTSVLPVVGADMVSVKSSTPIPKEKLFACIELLRTVRLQAPVHIGDVLVPNILGTGADIIATKNIGG